MPQETERPIEKMLRNLAKRRREDARAAGELHPATRRMLHAEVARKFAAQPSQRRTLADQVLRFWPKLAWGLATSAALFVGVWLLLLQPNHKEPQTLLAKNERQTAAAQSRSSGDMPVLTPAQPELRDKTTAVPEQTPGVAGPRITLAEDQAKAVSALAKNEAGATQAITQTEPVQGQPLALTSEMELGTQSTTTQQPELSPRPTPAAPVAELVRRATEPETTANVSTQGRAATGPGVSNVLSAPGQNFVSTAVLTDYFQTVFRSSQPQPGVKASQLKARAAYTDVADTTSPVLASFQIEQTGHQLRVIDHDGSIYSGFWQAGSADGVPVSAYRISSGVAQELDQRVLRAGLIANSALPPNYSFTVTGTNVTSKQRVVFLGKLIETTNATAPDQQAPRAQLQQGTRFQFAPTRSQLLPPLKKRLSGKAVLDDKLEITIEAISPSAQKEN